MARSFIYLAVLLALSTCTLVGCITPVQIASTARTSTSITATGPSVAPESTALPLPTFGPPECQQRHPAIDPLQYEVLMYGENACKLLSISPNGEYLAYVTLTMTGDKETASQIEVVKLMQRGTTEGYPIYEVEPYFPIFYLQWSASNQLVFGGGYEGGHTVVYDPAAMCTPSSVSSATTSRA